MVERKVEKIMKKKKLKKEKLLLQMKKTRFKIFICNVKRNSEKLLQKKEVNNVEKSIDPKRFKSKFEKRKNHQI